MVVQRNEARNIHRYRVQLPQKENEARGTMEIMDEIIPFIEQATSS